MGSEVTGHRLVDVLGSDAHAELEQIAASSLGRELAAGSVGRSRYERFLSDLYPVVWHFCPTMAVAASRCPDAFSEVRSFLYAHAEEEHGHELWVLDDCEAIGGPELVARVRSGRPCAEVQGLIGFHYAAVEREHPLAVLGMIFALESIAARIAGHAAESFSKALQLPGERGVRFLSSHGPMDAGHLAELGEVLARIEDPRAGRAIRNAASVTFRLFGAVFR